MGLILPRRAVLAAPALILPHRRANAQMMQGILAGKSAAPGPFWTLIASTSVVNTTSGAVNTSAIDTTGADFICAGIGYGGFLGSAPSISDSKGNSWTAPLGDLNPGSLSFVGSLPAVVGTGHTFTVTNPGGNRAAALIVYAFKSASGTPFVDSNGGNGLSDTIPTVTSGTTIATSNPSSSATPSGANRLIWSTAVGFGEIVSFASVNSGLTITLQSTDSSAAIFGMAWGISSSAVTVVWTTTSAVTSNAAAKVICIGSV